MGGSIRNKNRGELKLLRRGARNKWVCRLGGEPALTKSCKRSSAIRAAVVPLHPGHWDLLERTAPGISDFQTQESERDLRKAVGQAPGFWEKDSHEAILFWARHNSN